LDSTLKAQGERSYEDFSNKNADQNNLSATNLFMQIINSIPDLKNNDSANPKKSDEFQIFSPAFIAAFQVSSPILNINELTNTFDFPFNGCANSIKSALSKYDISKINSNVALEVLKSGSAVNSQVTIGAEEIIVKLNKSN
jgi:hypothetical protein